MRGEMVLVRAFGDVPLVRRVWEAGESTVYITDDEQLGKHIAGLCMLPPIGFPREDVFRFSPDIHLDSNVKWEEMQRWEPTA